MIFLILPAVAAAAKAIKHGHKAVHHGSRIATNVHKAAWTAGGATALRRTIPTQSAHQFVKEITKPR